MRGLTLAIVAALAMTYLRAEAMDRFLGATAYEDVYYLPSPVWMRRFALGHDEALADLVWMKALVYVGDEFAHRGDVENVYRYADVIVALDPDFRRVYSWATTMGLYRPTRPTLEEGLEAVRYLERGLERFPDDGELTWELAATYAYELPSLTDDVAEKERFRSVGSDHMVTAARLGAGPPWLALTNASHLETLGRFDQAIRHLEEMYALVQDDDTREQIELRLEGLRAGAAAEALRSTERDLRDRHQRDFPWIPVDFYVVVGPRKVPHE
ncbi:MAG: hypothetical protein H6721_22660 [Sandaracinus sp.]|nr:hypothetical protein [Sandaracinus sp.]MCB9624705.1 hypothetical protein [Sandaracinus sp.]MCB9634935.1 hypothetical protein [Sandaracinus sp.]